MKNEIISDYNLGRSKLMNGENNLLLQFRNIAGRNYY